MKNQSGLRATIPDQNVLLITRCSSPWLKPFAMDTLLPRSSSVQTKLKCSPMSDGSDQPMSVSPSELQSSSEEDEESEAETYPLLSEFNNKQLDPQADTVSHLKKDSFTMDDIGESTYQYQNFDSRCPIAETGRWDKWNGEWCPISKDTWFSKDCPPPPQNAKSNSHNIKFSPNPALETTALSNNNQNTIKFTFDGDIWHDSAWSRPRRTTAKSLTTSSRSFEDMIVDIQADNTLYRKCPMETYLKSQTKAHTNINSNTVPPSESVDNTKVSPITNPFERFFPHIKPVNSNMPLKRSIPLPSKEFAVPGSKVSNNTEVVEIKGVRVQPFVNQNPQPKLAGDSPNRSSPQNVNLQIVDGSPFSKETNGTNAKISHDFSKDDKIFTPRSESYHQKEYSGVFETSKKRISSDNVNLVTRSFNNFSLSSSKQKEILRLLQERRKSRETNISETKTFYEETKILNIQSNPLTSSSVRRRFKKIDRQLIADGLVLEKVRYDPNWKRRNRILCTSDEVLRHFGDAPKKDVNVPTSVPTQTCTSGVIEDSKIFKIANPEKSGSASFCNSVPLVPESPTDNVTITDNSNILHSSDINSNDNSLNKDTDRCNKHIQPTLSQDATSKSAKLPKPASELFGDFDVYNIETTMPTIDWAAMEAHLTRAAEEDDWLTSRRNDREEIRKRLALDTEDDEHDYYCGERVSRKPSLSTRLQSGMNLQICFMNETASDHESPVEDYDRPFLEASSSLASSSCSSHESSLGSTQDSLCLGSNPLSMNSSTAKETSQSTNFPDKLETKHQRPSFFFAKQRSWRLRPRQKHEQQTVNNEVAKDCQAVATEDFYTKQARLQAEARLALAQAKDMAKMQMEVEKQRKTKKSPIADIVGLSFPDNRHFSKQLLQDMNVAQLQVIVNDLHSQIESHNEDLVHFLLKRDDLHMEQDSMLVDIEDLTRYLGAKEDIQVSQQKPKNAKDCRSK